MTAPTYQELATLADFLRLGLPPDALRLARTTQAPVSATGAGAGLVVPGGTLDVGALGVATLDVLVDVVAGGALGSATWRWSHDGGTTWTTAIATPAAGVSAALTHPALGIPTGLTLRFVGAQTTGARFGWTATSVVADCGRAANDEAFRAYGDRYGGALGTVPADIIRDVCCVWAADVAAVIGYRPGDGADVLLEQRAAGARKRWRDVRTHNETPRADGPRTARRGPFVVSRPRR